MPRQNTFTVVPNPLGMQGLISRDNAPASKPQAMTSKQAKKLYKQATKQPRLSKAEQRRLELEEQERIRKELDKQKSANKARIAREKKKAKELAEIQARKKKGLPLVDVHPSQDTISRFVRVGVANTATKRDSSGNVKGPAVDQQSRTVSPERDDSNKENIPDGGGVIDESLRKRPRLDQDSQSNRQDAVTIPCKESISGVEDTTITNKENVPWVEDRTESTSQRTSQPRRSGKEGSQSHDKTKTRTESNTQRLETPEEVVMVLPKPTRLQPDRNLEDMGLSRPQSVEALQPRRLENAPLKLDPVKKVVKPLPTGMRPRPILGVTDGNRSTPAKPSKETVPPQGYQKLEHVNKEKEQQLPKESSQPKPKASTPNTSVVRSAVEASKAFPSPQPHVSPIPPPPRPSMSARQPSNAARLKPPGAQHQVTAPANPPGPSSTTANPNKFPSPHRPMGPPALVPQRPSPGPPSFKRPMVRPSSGGIQKPKFLPRNYPQASASRSSLSSIIGKPAVSTNNTPPTSTQLFVMSHLDDLLPSPSQELRELEEDTGSTATSRPPVFKSQSDKQGQAPAVVPKSSLAPGPKRFTRQTSHVQIAPSRPRIQEVKPVEDDIFPFLSTQDLLFSSQDIRELESDTPTKVDNRKDNFQHPLKPSPKTAFSSPSIVTVKETHPYQTATTTPAPKPVPGLASSKQMTSVPALSRQSSIGSVTSNPQATSTAYKAQRPSIPASIMLDPKTASALASQKQAEAISPPSNPSQRPRASANSSPKLSPAIGDDQQAEVPNPSLPTAAAATPPTPKPAPRPRSPSPQRFFGSSGVGIQILLAMAESEKTFREDEERRQEKARREQLMMERRKKAAEERAKKAAEEKRKRAAEERAAVMERLRRQGEEIAQLKIPSARRTESPAVAPEQRPAATQAKQLPGQSIKQLIPSISKVKRSISGWVPPQRTSVVKPVIEANPPQQPSLSKSNVQAQHLAEQKSLVPSKTTPMATPNPSMQAQDQISQILEVSPAPSQGTDYGDADLDALGELGGMGLTQFLGPEKDLSWLDDDDDF
ncbi:hypothetical protein NEUTE1DRAFT_80781 [Neurospora tetrasperma FGSC 2508]|uniref:Uncharacterized protein n=1 Tax=Neurospora tetrasperma (strain FGSC 2508 / ATCC MYA-4615 / P0657) TaxID=510951 RepID=F8MJN4_NEUT8|nr:uncharacterized protein NEUTE1DRAFT_80781 [Neurospora tetrasperma FGSC 2508]EGO57275.1 hypothetical protein NEUTE1DRAFT_80781 [Neurospora tetrasperma FGSC 2508]EGZ72477.1 hypothetical protein NEUTE2DRAFT_90708 [Neurospora tetrasperma FGSC 2509]